MSREPRKRKRVGEPQAPNKLRKLSDFDDILVSPDNSLFYEDIAIVLNHGDQPATLLGSWVKRWVGTNIWSVYGEKPLLEGMATNHPKSDDTVRRILKTRERPHRDLITEENGFEVLTKNEKTTPFQIYKELTTKDRQYPCKIRGKANATKLYNAIRWYLFDPIITVTAKIDENETTTLTVDEGYPKDALQPERFVMFTKPDGTVKSFEICTDRSRKFIKTRLLETETNRYKVKVERSQQETNNMNDGWKNNKKVYELLKNCLSCDFKHILFIKRNKNSVNEGELFRKSYDNERICGITLFYFHDEETSSYTSVIALPNRESAKYVISKHNFLYEGQNCQVKFSNSLFQDCSLFLG